MYTIVFDSIVNIIFVTVIADFLTLDFFQPVVCHSELCAFSKKEYDNISVHTLHLVMYTELHFWRVCIFCSYFEANTPNKFNLIKDQFLVK